MYSVESLDDRIRTSSTSKALTYWVPARKFKAVKLLIAESGSQDEHCYGKRGFHQIHEAKLGGSITNTTHFNHIRSSGMPREVPKEETEDSQGMILNFFLHHCHTRTSLDKKIIKYNAGLEFSLSPDSISALD